MLKIFLIFIMCFTLISSAFAQQSVTGTVTGVDGAGIPGVTIIEKGTSNGTTTDIDGKYSLPVASGDAVLVFSFIGMLTIDEPLSNRTSVNVVMATDAVGIDEVVVTALGIKREMKALGYSVSEVEGEIITKAATVNPVKALQGRVAGVNIATTNDGAFEKSRITIRGNSTLQKNTQPIFVIDGVLMDNDVGGSWGNEIKNLNSDDFESFTVLKGAAATALYGSRALHGVVLITTKSGKKRDGLGVSVNQTTGFSNVYDEPAFQNEYGYGGVAGLFSNHQTNGRPDKDKHDNQQFNNYELIDGEYIPSLRTQQNSEENAASWGPRFNGQDYIDYDGSMAKWVAQPDLYKKFYRTGTLNNTNVAIDGGSDSGTFRMSYSNYSKKGVSLGDDFKKNSLSIKGTQNLLKDIIKITAGVHYTKSSASRATGGPAFFHDGFPRSYDIDKWENNYKDIDGGVPYPEGNTNGRYISTRQAKRWMTIKEDENLRDENMLLINSDIDFNIAKGLTGKIKGSINQFNTKNELRQTAKSADRLSDARFSMSHGQKFQYSFGANLAYEKQITEDLHMDFMVGVETWSTAATSTSISTNRGFKVRDFYNIKNSFDPATASGGIGRNKEINSVYGFINADYKGQLFLQITGRNDWSSALVYPDGTGTPGFFYPSASLSWIVTESLELPEFISFAKARFSYSVVGNDTDPYTLSTGFVSDVYGADPNYNMYRYESTTSIQPGIKAELKKSFETGLDLRFLHGKLGIDFAYYKDNTTNQILELQVPSESGISKQLINAGNLQNSGVELAINAIPIQNKDFTWDLGINYTKSRDKIIELYPGVEQIVLSGNWDDANTATATIAYAGGDYGMLATRRGWKYYQATDSEGNSIDHPNNGKIQLEQRNGWTVAYPNGTQNKDSLQILGNMQPDFYGSFTTSFRYKAFSLSALIDFSFGADMYSSSYRYGMHQGVLESSLPNRDAESGGIVWTSEGMGQNFYGKEYQDGYIPDGVFPDGKTIKYKDADKQVYRTVDIGGMTYQDAYDQGLVEPTHWSGYMYRWTSASTGSPMMSIHKADWIGLRELSLTYTVPSKVLTKTFIGGASFSVTGRDLGLFYNSMPDNIYPAINNNEAGTAFETGSNGYTRTIIMALKLNF